MPFIETLIYYYCSFKYNQNEYPEIIRLSNSMLLPGETEDPFSSYYEFDKNKKFIELSKDSYRLDENCKSDGETDYRYEIVISNESFIKVCKEINVTPVILLSLLMSKAILKLIPNSDKVINANIATDMREALNCKNTFKNCVKSMMLPYDKEFGLKKLYEQASLYRDILNLQRDFDFCKKEANAMLGLFDKLDSLEN